MSKKLSDRRRRVRKANHGARPHSGRRPRKLRGSGKK